MDVAFIVHINVQDVSTITDEAEHIQDDLTRAGHDVLSVVPYARGEQRQGAFLTPFQMPGAPPPPTEPPTIPNVNLS